MSNILHILNGQGTAYPFQKSGIPGDTVVWNEALALGPVIPEVGSQAFWQLRSNYHTNAYFGLDSLQQPEESFEQLVLAQIAKLHKVRHYQEIVLWFEYDLFCQINLIALASWLSKHELDETVISLVSIDQFPGISNFKGLGQLSPNNFPELFSQRQILKQTDLHQAAKIWAAYCHPDPRLISTAMAEQPLSAFPFLTPALQKHFQRFPSTKNGLNEQEHLLLATIAGGSHTQRQLVGSMLEQDYAYGFGDLYYYLSILQLAPLLNIESQITINSHGTAVLKGEADFLDLQTQSVPIGGAINRDYRWDVEQKSLIPAI